MSERPGRTVSDEGAVSLRLGRQEDVLAGVEVDAVITDPPYSKRVHDGHDTAAAWTEDIRRPISYSAWDDVDVRAFVDSWAPRNRGWFVCLSDHGLVSAYEDAFRANGLTAFAPVTVLIPGMTVRMAGDGPSSWTIYVNVARPKRLSRWGTLPGGYTGPPGERVHVGGKPEWLMRALVRDYSKSGDLVCDPYAGAGTTLVAAVTENRLAVGAEVDPDTYEVARKRVAKPYTPTLFDQVA